MKNKFMTRSAQPKPKTQTPDLPKEPEHPQQPTSIQPAQNPVSNTKSNFLQKKNFYFSESNNSIAFSIDSKPSGRNIFHQPSYKTRGESGCRLELGFLDHSKKLL